MTNPDPSPNLAPPFWRWSVLVAVSVAMFGNYYAYDSVGPVADLLQKQLGFTDTQIGTLNAIYSFPNIVMVLIGGILLDRFGARQTTLVFAIICTLARRSPPSRRISRSWPQDVSSSAWAPRR